MNKANQSETMQSKRSEVKRSVNEKQPLNKYKVKIK